MFVTSILSACFMNSSLPIGLTFSNGKKKKERKMRLFNVIEYQISINFSSKVFKSDQGKVLFSIYQVRNIVHLKYICPLLANLKYNLCSNEIGQLVQCSSQFELDNHFKSCKETK